MESGDPSATKIFSSLSASATVRPSGPTDLSVYSCPYFTTFLSHAHLLCAVLPLCFWPIFSGIIELICANPLMINNSSNTLCLGKCAKSLKYLQIWKQTGYPAISSRHYLALVRDISVVLPKNTSFF